MNQTPDIVTLLKARTTVLWVTTVEELRVERAITEAAGKANFKAVLWDCDSGTTDTQGQPFGKGAQNRDPSTALNELRGSNEKAVWIMRDLDVWLNQPDLARKVKSLARDLQAARPGTERAVVILSCEGRIPPTLKGSVFACDWPLPDREAVGSILDSTTQATIAALNERIKTKGADDRTKQRLASLEAIRTNGARETAVDAAVGLTAEEVAGCYARSLVSVGTIDPDKVRKDKASVISREKVLEWYEPDPMGLEGVGGLGGLKDWLRQRRTAFSPAARDYGLPTPKGVMLVGIPGCLHGDTVIHDPVTGTTETVRERHQRGERFHVWSLHPNGEPVIAAAERPHKYDPAQMVEIEFENGETIRVTLGHRFWDGEKWITASEVYERLQRSEPVLLPTNADTDLAVRAEDALRWSETTPGSLVDCRSDLRSCGAPPPLVEDDD